MIAVQAYYDGANIRPLEAVAMKQNQKIILTVMDEYMDLESSKEKFPFDIFSGGLMYIADDFDETPECFKEYL